MTDRCDDATPNETMSQFSLHRHLMISNNEVTNIVGGGEGREGGGGGQLVRR